MSFGLKLQKKKKCEQRQQWEVLSLPRRRGNTCKDPSAGLTREEKKGRFGGRRKAYSEAL